jgi:HlyD family secretion protein
VTDSDALFRKTALAHVSTPERFDGSLRLASSKAWLALVAIFILFGSAAFWVCRGSVATTVSGHAVIVRSGGMMTIYSQGMGGQVTGLNVSVGDVVQARQILARIAQPNLAEKIRATEDALQEAEREGVRAVSVRRQSSNLQVAAIERQRGNVNREIEALVEQAEHAEKQIAVEEQLLAWGLTTKRQVIDAKHKFTSIQADISRRRAQLVQMDAEQYGTCPLLRTLWRHLRAR